jgi:hypothetical protein
LGKDHDAAWSSGGAFPFGDSGTSVQSFEYPLFSYKRDQVLTYSNLFFFQPVPGIMIFSSDEQANSSSFTYLFDDDERH